VRALADAGELSVIQNFDPSGPNRRRWRDLSKQRLLLGLALSPVGPWIVGVALIVMLGGGSSGLFDALIVGSLAAAVIWSLIGGSAYLFLIGRWRGAVRRAECFLLGIVLAATLPFTAVYARQAADWISGSASPLADDWVFASPSDFDFAVVVAILLVPFGAVGGWVLWRVGVRPAQPKLEDAAPVFD
jgi:hypothetical protein